MQPRAASGRPPRSVHVGAMFDSSRDGAGRRHDRPTPAEVRKARLDQIEAGPRIRSGAGPGSGLGQAPHQGRGRLGCETSVGDFPELPAWGGVLLTGPPESILLGARRAVRGPPALALGGLGLLLGGGAKVVIIAMRIRPVPGPAPAEPASNAGADPGAT